MDIEIINEKDRTVMKPQGTLSISTISIFERELNRCFNDFDSNLVIDMYYIERIDSLSLATMIKFYDRFVSKGRTMQVINCNEAVKRVIEISGLESFLLGDA